MGAYECKICAVLGLVFFCGGGDYYEQEAKEYKHLMKIWDNCLVRNGPPKGMLVQGDVSTGTIPIPASRDSAPNHATGGPPRSTRDSTSLSQTGALNPVSTAGAGSLTPISVLCLLISALATYG